jgi:hypothetical protein
MPTRVNGEGPGVGEAAKRVADHAKALVNLEVELATLELKGKVAALGAGIALLAAGGILALYGLGFLFATAAAGLDTFMPHWLSLLVVALALFGIGGVLALIGKQRVDKGTPPTPDQAIREAKLTTEALKADGNV